MKTKIYKSLVEAVVNAIGFMSVSGYEKRHVSPDNAERQVNRDYGKAQSCFPSVGVNAEFDGVYLRFPFDSETWDISKDRRHHTTVDIGSVLKSTLHKGYEIVAVCRGDKGQFEKFKIAFETLCPVIPESLRGEYHNDRLTYETESVTLNKAIDQAKKRGLIEKRPYNPSGETYYRIDNIRQTWKLAGLPSGSRCSWKNIDDDSLMEMIESLRYHIANSANDWRTIMGLDGIEDSQVFRILDAGLVEVGAWGAVVNEKNDPAYVSPEQFERMLQAGEIVVTSVDPKPIAKRLTTA